MANLLKILHRRLFSVSKRRHLTYRRLPDQLLKLSVLKLDGSCFSFQVHRNVTVARLKLAIEEEFSLHFNNERCLWSLVWSHFCLDYKGKKLTRDDENISKYGIKDGDQLHFIHYMRAGVELQIQTPNEKQIQLK